MMGNIYLKHFGYIMRAWYATSLQLITLLLLPFSWLFRVCTAVRRLLYSIGFIKSKHFDVPVIIVGNITVGGTGKTPFVIWLATLLRAQGYNPGIVSRGVGGEKHHEPYWVKADDMPSLVGDEAVLLAMHSHCPVVICIDRSQAVADLLLHSDCDMVISDDGLQHYRLQRDIEIVIVDGGRRFGNRQLLPAGPLREPLARLKKVDFVVTNAGQSTDDYVMSLQPTSFISIRDPKNYIDLAQAKQFFLKKVHAVAGIGHPERFFNMLKQLGLDIIPHVFPDHHLYHSEDLEFNDELPIVMTEKDAVKCRDFADNHYWFLAVHTKIDNRFEEALLVKIKTIKSLENGYVYEKDFTNSHDNVIPERDDTRCKSTTINQSK